MNLPQWVFAALAAALVEEVEKAGAMFKSDEYGCARIHQNEKAWRSIRLDFDRAENTLRACTDFLEGLRDE